MRCKKLYDRRKIQEITIKDRIYEIHSGKIHSGIYSFNEKKLYNGKEINKITRDHRIRKIHSGSKGLEGLL